MARRHRLRVRQLSFYRRCPRCKVSKLYVDFTRNRATWDGYATYCRPCNNEVTKINKVRRYGSERNFLLNLRYGVTEEQVDRMIAEQGGLCALCRAGPAEHVDHDHLAGRVRGVLCFKCNNGLGKFGDDAHVIRSAIEYLGGTP